MIGYYVHHVGRGHLHRAGTFATAVAARGDEEVTGLSSLPRPGSWRGPWLQLDRDDAGTVPLDPTARGVLHWAPLSDAGLTARMRAVAEWIASCSPTVVVCDVSVEVALLCRLLGVRVATVVMPGDRGDRAHVLGRDVSDLLVACWPPGADGMVTGLSDDDRSRLVHLGAVARHPVAAARTPKHPAATRSVAVLSGQGGGGLPADAVARARALTPGWTWTVLGGPAGQWVEDPRGVLEAADVVVTHAGQNALAEVAAARRPAVVVPERRPHGEQERTAAVLVRGPWPAVVERSPGDADWPALLAAADRLDGDAWSSWCDGRAADRFVGAVLDLAADVGAQVGSPR